MQLNSLVAATALVALVAACGGGSSNSAPQTTTGGGAGGATGGQTGGGQTGGGAAATGADVAGLASNPAAAQRDGFDGVGPGDTFTLTGPARSIPVSGTQQNPVIGAPVVADATGVIVLDQADQIASVALSGNGDVALTRAETTSFFEGVPNRGENEGRQSLFMQREVPGDERIIDLRFGNRPGGGGDGSFTYMGYGLWDNLPESGDAALSGTVTYGAIGFETPTGNVPTSGAATYAGEAVGTLLTAAGAGDLQADVTAGVDFGARTFTFNTSNTVADLSDDDTFNPTPQPGRDITGGGALTGGRLAGAVTSGALSGGVEAALYGPQAQELGGSFGLSGGGETIVGSFGATR